MHTINAEYFSQMNKALFLETQATIEKYFNYAICKKINIHHLILHKIENETVKFVTSQINNIQLAYILVFWICTLMRDAGL